MTVELTEEEARTICICLSNKLYEMLSLQVPRLDRFSLESMQNPVRRMVKISDVLEKLDAQRYLDEAKAEREKVLAEEESKMIAARKEMDNRVAEIMKAQVEASKRGRKKGEKK